jgi:hypothetical protein
MKSSLLSLTVTVTAFVLLSTVRHCSAQIAGCDASGMDCPTKATASKDGICSFDSGDIGVVSFDSNITSDGPLTWTVAAADGKGNGAYPKYSARSFFLGTPSSLNLRDTTDFGACSTVFWNFTANLQLPAGFTDFANFGCHSVMGDQCAQDVAAQARSELARLLNDSTHDPVQRFPCETIQDRMSAAGPPESCREAFQGCRYLFGESTSKSNSPQTHSPSQQDHTLTLGPIVLTNVTEGNSFMYQSQDDCSLTTGGSSYTVVSASSEDTLNLFNSEKPSKEYLELFKTGVTPVLTYFYNEHWNPASTGPAPFLSEPEVHLSCLRAMSEEEQKSGSIKVETTLSGLSLVPIFLGSLLWLYTMV